MAENKEPEEGHPSNMSAADHERRASDPTLNISSDKVGNPGRNWGWVLSGIICVNILILGSVLIVGSAYDEIHIKSTDLQIFLIIIILLTSIWMIYYSIFTARVEHAVNYKDAHAGPVWLRGGLLLFGILSILMDIFKIASYVGYLHCDSAVKVAFPVVQLVFTCVQIYFFWIHAKDCVQLQKNITCCGLMLTLSTNLALWMTSVTEESLHQTVVPEDLSNVTKLSFRNFYMNKASYGADKCKCSHTSCSIFNQAYYYLYPFNIEYSLFASAMAYVMWKNVGRETTEHGHHIKFRFKDIFIGPIFGILLVLAGLATFIVYEMEIQKEHHGVHETDHAVMMHFVMNIVIVSLMSAVTVIGSVMYRIDHRDHVSEKNPTRNLDVGLLVGASLGQFIISYFSIVALVATEVKGYLNRLDIAWAIMMVIQLVLQNVFIIEGLHREPFHESVDESITVVSNPYVLEHGKDLHSHVGSNPHPELPTHGLHGHTAKHKLSWTRRALKEVCVFLLLGNIILWIMPAFGARPQFDYSIEIEFYKFNIWATVVNVGLPFGIFYRMHAVASLFEVFVNS